MSQQDWPHGVTLSGDDEDATSIRFDLYPLELECSITINERREGDEHTPAYMLSLSRDDVRELAAVFHAARNELEKLHRDRQQLQAAAQIFISQAGGIEAARAALEAAA